MGMYSRLLVLLAIFALQFSVSPITVVAQDTDNTPIALGTTAIDSLGIEMVYVPSGVVQMGIERDAFRNLLMNGIFDEFDANLNSIGIFEGEGIFETYEAHLPNFWIDKYEVSVRQYENIWLRCRDTNTCTDSSLPIEVNWFEAIDFCANRDARLPSEEEWEYAASGPQNFVFPWGNTLNLENQSVNAQAPASLHPVGSEPQNVSWVGAYDMSGNAPEWTDDLYQPYYSWENTAFSDWYDYNREHSRVIRGGSYELGTMQKTTYVRTGMYYRGTAGFRCVRMTHP